MMFIVRSGGPRPIAPALRVALTRRTPALVAEGSDQVDHFCEGPDDLPERLRQQGWRVVLLGDGWYQDDGEGGVAIWGQGKYWEVRDTPFSVKEAVGSAVEEASTKSGEGDRNVRGSIFGV